MRCVLGSEHWPRQPQRVEDCRVIGSSARGWPSVLDGRNSSGSDPVTSRRTTGFHSASAVHLSANICGQSSVLNGSKVRWAFARANDVGRVVAVSVRFGGRVFICGVELIWGVGETANRSSRYAVGKNQSRWRTRSAIIVRHRLGRNLINVHDACERPRIVIWRRDVRPDTGRSSGWSVPGCRMVHARQST
jgi:hypothetical protein